MAVDQFTSEVEYRSIDRFPGYRFGSDGSVWSKWTQVWQGYRKPFRTVLGNQESDWSRLVGVPASRCGHLHVWLKIEGTNQSKNFLVHRLILEAFVSPPPEGMVGRHFPDRDPSNNRIDNLSWGTPLQNTADRIAHGTVCWGEKHPMAKLNWAKVDEIRQRVGQGTKKRLLAEEFHVS